MAREKLGLGIVSTGVLEFSCWSWFQTPERLGINILEIMGPQNGYLLTPHTPNTNPTHTKMSMLPNVLKTWCLALWMWLSDSMHASFGNRKSWVWNPAFWGLFFFSLSAKCNHRYFLSSTTQRWAFCSCDLLHITRKKTGISLFNMLTT